MTEETALVEQVPEITAILAPAGNFSDYMRRLLEASSAAIEELQQKIIVTQERSNDVEAIEAAERALQAALHTPGQIGHDQAVRWRAALNSLTRRKKIRLARLKKNLVAAQRMVEALHAGYVPLPRMPAVKMDYMYQVMPAEVLDALTEAAEQNVFEEFRVIDGRDTNRMGVPVGTRSPAKRDPILVGMIGDEMFAVGWWR